MAVDPPELPGGWLPPQAPERPAPRAAPDDHPQARPLPVFAPSEPQPRNPMAITATVCAVLSMGLLVFSVGLSFLVSLPLGITGWLFASRSDPELNPGQRKTGQVLSMIAVGLSLGAMLIWVLLVLAGYTPEELQHSLEEELERRRRAS
jgi:hypothetical protein